MDVLHCDENNSHFREQQFSVMLHTRFADAAVYQLDKELLFWSFLQPQTNNNFLECLFLR
jgi:hypothetical protein